MGKDNQAVAYSYTNLFQQVVRAKEVMVHGGRRTRELVGATLELPADVIPLRPGQVLALGYMELLQLVAGHFDLRALKRVAPNANHELFTPQMAYGPRTLVWEEDRVGIANVAGDQLTELHAELVKDPTSRRAVLSIIDPRDPLQPETTPCTLTIQFLHRGYLHGLVTMRSWDLWWGLPYDMVIFGGVVQLMARCLNLEVGGTRVTAGSAHLYEPHWGLFPKSEVLLFSFEESVPRNWPALRRWARGVVADQGWVSGPPPGIRQETVAQWSARVCP